MDGRAKCYAAIERGEFVVPVPSANELERLAEERKRDEAHMAWLREVERLEEESPGTASWMAA
jgi:hypothetical protein